MGPREAQLFGDVLDDFGPSGLDLLMTVGGFINRHAPVLSNTSTFATGANYLVTRRLGEFGAALAEYDRLLREIAPNKAGFRSELVAADQAFGKLQQQFKIEMEVMARSNRYSGWMYHPLESFAGGVEASARNPTSPLANLRESLRLRQVLSATERLGKGLIVIDLGFRARNVATSDHPGLQLGEEVFSFAGSSVGTWAGYSAILLGARALLMATPHGWIIVIFSVAAGAALAYLVDQVGRRVYRKAASRLESAVGAR